MSYSSIANMADDVALNRRLTAAAAQEGKTKPYEDWVQQWRWDLASTPGWAEAWDSALAGGNQAPGDDPGVITDGMILAAVQPMGEA